VKLNCWILIPCNCVTVDDFFVLDKTASDFQTRINNKSHIRKADKATSKPTPHRSSMKVSLNSLFLHSLGDNTTTMVCYYSSLVFTCLYTEREKSHGSTSKAEV